MNLDSFFTKGESHKVCQDYAIHGETATCAYAIVCDGCSSSLKTDLGARLLAESFSYALKCSPSYFFEGESATSEFVSHIKKLVGGNLQDFAAILGLPQQTFDATLLAAVLHKKSNRLIIFQWGDGRVTKCFKDGRREETKIIYTENAPAYFSYTVWPERYTEYEQYFKNQEAILWKTSPDQLFDIKSQTEGLYVEICDATDLKFVHLTSDGVESFQDSNENSISVAQDFTNFKGFEGEFVQRRMNRILKETKKEGATHYDDLGAAAIAF